MDTDSDTLFIHGDMVRNKEHALTLTLLPGGDNADCRSICTGQTLMLRPSSQERMIKIPGATIHLVVVLEAKGARGSEIDQLRSLQAAASCQ